MSTSSILSLGALLLLSSVTTGCAPQQACPPGAASTTSTGGSTRSPGSGDRHVYRFDFVLTSDDHTAPATSTAFTLVLEEHEKGEVVVGKNVVLATAASTATATTTAPGAGPSFGAARQDVGVKVAAVFWAAGADDVVLEVSSEVSALEPPTSIRKMVSRGNALATSGKAALVTTLEDDHKKYQLTVTPTKLR